MTFFFIGGLKHSLKCIHLNNGYKYDSIPTNYSPREAQDHLFILEMSKSERTSMVDVDTDENINFLLGQRSGN